MKGRWGVHICTCEGRLPVDPELLKPISPFVDIGQHPRVSAQPLATRLKGESLDGVVVACCQGAEPFEQALRDQHVPLAVRWADHKGRCYETVPDAAAANGKALRFLRGEVRAAQQADAPDEVPLQVGKRVVIVTELASGLGLAETLTESANVTLVVDPGLALPPDFPARRARRGLLKSVTGRLGAFSVRIGSGSESVQDLAADQVVVLAKESSHVKARTGLHVLIRPEPANVAALPAAVADLIGDFMKPLAIRYDTAVCAGGAASNQACGRCIPACPYQAISRDASNPLRIAVDQLACEACGACTAACPTSALQLTEPNVGEILGRMAGLLGPVASASDAPLGVVFHCSQQGRRTLDAAGERSRAVAATLLPIEVPCLRHVSDALLLGAFRMGAAGAALLGCETCPHGERALLQLNMDTAHRVVTAAGMGAGRVQLITARDGAARPEDALEQLDAFAAGLQPTQVRFALDRHRPVGNRELVAEAIGAFVEAYGSKPEPVKLAQEAPYATAKVRADGCTLCRSCTNVCPTHAFRFDESEQTLLFKQIDCVACGLCEAVCPENVITLHRELSLNATGLEHQALVRDEMIKCAKCAKPYVNKRALEAIEAKVRTVPKLAGVFEGNRAQLLRMCPDCRAIASMLNVRDGWQP
jgi:ferredoxin